MNTENIVPRLRKETVNPVGDLLEGGVTPVIRRLAIHGRKSNDAFESNPVTGEYASSAEASRTE